MLTNREKVIALVNSDIVRKSDAIILLEGDGLNRFQHAFNLYKTRLADKIVFSGNIVNYEYGSYPFSDIKPLLLNQGIDESALIYENRSLNTYEQAVEIIKIVAYNNWKRIILVASPEHQCRAYLTFLRQVIDSACGLIIYNSSAHNLKWFENSDWGKRFDRLDVEFERIENYSELGHLATFEEAIEYQKWKEKQQ